jgi:hypothetical protein
VVVEERRSIFVGSTPASRHDSRIVEHELDMVRHAERRAPVAGRLAKILKWLMPDGRVVGPPMRSVGRELEEAFPARDI